MAPEVADTAIRECLKLMSQKLGQAAAIAKAAYACAEADDLDQAIQIALGIETPVYDARSLLNAVTLFQREAGS